MNCPTFDDLGKQSRDIFSKGYHFGLVKLMVNTKTDSGIELKTEGISDIDTNKVNGFMETKFKFPKYGIICTEKLTSANGLSTKVDFQHNNYKKFKVTADCDFSLQTGVKVAKVKSEIKDPLYTANLVFNNENLVASSLVLKHNNFHAGFQAAFNASKSQMTNNKIAIEYANNVCSLHGYANNGEQFGANIYHKINDKLLAGFKVGFSLNSPINTLGLACHYKLDENTSLRAKIDSSSLLGLSYEQVLRPGISITLSSRLNAQNLNQGGHRIGLCLNMSA